MAAKPISAEDLNHILTQTRPVWEEMRGQSIFITGGTGFFGCWLVESFCHINRALSLNAHATVLSRDPSKFAEKCPHLASDPAITLHAGDVRDFEFPPSNFAYVIHAATEASAKQAAEEPLEMLSTILAGTERTLKFAAECGARKFLLTSSGAVYGKQPSDMTHVPESFTGAPDPLDPASVYAEGKRASELMCALHQKTARASGIEFEAKIARCWAFCGPHLPLDTHFAIGNFIGDVLAGRPIGIGGDGIPRRSYLYGADLAIWLWTMLFRAPALTADQRGVRTRRKHPRTGADRRCNPRPHDRNHSSQAADSRCSPRSICSLGNTRKGAAGPARDGQTRRIDPPHRRMACIVSLRNACLGDTEEVRQE